MSTHTPRMPTLYIPHGAGPCFFMDWNPPDAWDATAAYLRSIAGSLPQRPKAIVLVTAHWLAPQFTAGSAAQPGMLFDYYGFPPHTYELTYPAAGAPALAADILAARPRRVIFNPGAENPELAAQLQAAGVEVVPACTLVMLKTGGF